LAALAAMMIVVATLAGCGRKGSLDLPPTAAGPTPQEAASAPSLGGPNDSPTHSLANPPPPPDAPPPPPPPARRWFPLDFLLN
jgi:predicted small lipoprotein YifL